MVRLDNVGLTYGRAASDFGRKLPAAALADLSFAIPAGGFRWLVGESGAGKTSLLGLLNLAVRPTSGRLLLLGREVPAQAQRGIRGQLPLLRRRIGMVFQDFRLLPHLTALDNVAAPLRIVGRSEREAREAAAEMLDWVGLGDQHAARPTELSGGEQQRVAIARAVVGRPSLLLADEPTGNLDAAQAERLLRLLREMNRLGATVVVATHNEALLARHPAPVLRLSGGRLVADG